MNHYYNSRGKFSSISRITRKQILCFSIKKSAFVIAVLLSSSALFGQQVFKFTNAGAVGQTGPSQAQINTAYTSTNLDGKVTCLNGYQYWTVPASGMYRIKAAGAAGGIISSSNAGQGAIMEADLMLIGGQVLKILVGQKGNSSASGSGSGGGGTFVATSDDVPLVVAGGGGGRYDQSSSLYNANAVTNNDAQKSGCNSGGSAGTNGNGGQGCSNNGAAGGGGFFTNGTTTSWGTFGYSFINGGKGGNTSYDPNCIGGFGGGGGTHGNTGGGGGGGGYSGGGGGYHSTSDGSGGGGGSFVLTTALKLNTSNGKYNNSSTFNGDVVGNLNEMNKDHGYVDITIISVGNSDIEAVSIKPITPIANTMCVRTKYEYEVTFKNNGPDDASYINFEVTAPGMTKLEYNFFDIRDLANGATKTYKIAAPDKISCNATGSQGLTLNITKVLSDGDNASNNLVTTYYNVVSLPYGTDFTPAAGFPGFIKVDQPTLVTHDKTYRYDFTPPTGYANSGYGTTWSTSFYGIIDNEPLPSDRYNIIPPAGSINGYLTLKLKKEDIDKNITFFFTVKEFVLGKCDSIISRDLHVAPMPDVSYEDVGGCLG
ncbi:MAG: hypothetical protein LC109_04910, partial [Bacteroidia bacterium]|nr:hypothetical protein [Bacteroidia bacterium]